MDDLEEILHGSDSGSDEALKGGHTLSERIRTPLYPVYEEFGARTVDFGGFDMPVQFSGIIAEHQAVRTRAGLFDVSHMGEFEVTGSGARGYLQQLMTNDISRIVPGMAMYSPMTFEHGGTVDDLLIYCFSETRFWTVVNAGNIAKDWDWMNHALAGREDVQLVNRSEEIALLALQGPLALGILQPFVEHNLEAIPYYRFVECTVDGDVPTVVSRTGYTGEDGFELYVPAGYAVRLWKRILDAAPDDVLPCGLGARDTLRLESRLPLYGHELTDEINPLEAGLSPFVKLDCGPFIGREKLSEVKDNGVARRVVGLRMRDKGIPRQGYAVQLDGRDVGIVTSGTMSPTLKEPIALVLVEPVAAKIGTELTVDIRGRRAAAVVCKTPFYRRPQ